MYEYVLISANINKVLKSKSLFMFTHHLCHTLRPMAIKIMSYRYKINSYYFRLLDYKSLDFI